MQQRVVDTRQSLEEQGGATGGFINSGDLAAGADEVLLSFQEEEVVEVVVDAEEDDEGGYEYPLVGNGHTWKKTPVLLSRTGAPKSGWRGAPAGGPLLEGAQEGLLP